MNKKPIVALSQQKEASSEDYVLLLLNNSSQRTVPQATLSTPCLLNRLEHKIYISYDKWHYKFTIPMTNIQPSLDSRPLPEFRATA